MPTRSRTLTATFHSHEFELSRGSEERIEDIAVVRTLPDDCEYHDFFWNHAERVASENGLQVHDVVLCERPIAPSLMSSHGPDVYAVEEIFHYAGAEVDCDEDDATVTSSATSHMSGRSTSMQVFHLYDITNPTHLALVNSEVQSDRVFFHQLPLLASGEAPSPWGYWSFDPEPTPGPWPVLELPGIELTCRYVCMIPT